MTALSSNVSFSSSNLKIRSSDSEIYLEEKVFSNQTFPLPSSLSERIRDEVTFLFDESNLETVIYEFPSASTI